MAYVKINLYDTHNGYLHRYAYVDDSMESEDNVTAYLLDIFPPDRYVLLDFRWIGHLTYNKMQQMWPQGEIVIAGGANHGDLDDFPEDDEDDVEDEEERDEEDDHPPDILDGMIRVRFPRGER